MVQRYAGAHVGANGMYKFDNGAWVKYEDYERLKNLIDTFFDCAVYDIDTDQILCTNPRDALSEILGYRV